MSSSAVALRSEEHTSELQSLPPPRPPDPPVPKPLIDGEDTKPWWGGYELSFKLIGIERYEQLRSRPGKLSIEAMTTGPGNKRVFKVDLSKHEYTQGREEHDLDDYTIYVYTPEMIVIEKLQIGRE